jgi:DNA-binding NtrC family response regulator
MPEGGGKKSKQTLKAARAQGEKEVIQSALIGHNGNVSKAAEDHGISRQALHHLINKKYGMQNFKRQKT